MSPNPRGPQRAKAAAHPGSRLSPPPLPPAETIRTLSTALGFPTIRIPVLSDPEPSRISTRRPKTGSLSLRETAAIRKVLEHERRRIARDIHDHAEQWIIGILFRLALIERNEGGRLTQTNSAEIRRYLDEMDRGLRRICVGLREPARYEASLQTLLTQLANLWAAEMGIPTRLDLESTAFPDANGVVTQTVAHIAQNLLNNVAKHAAASVVDIRLSVGFESIVLSVQDDGCGFCTDAEAKRRNTGQRLGMTSMRERLVEVGGRLEVKSAPGAGTIVTAEIPVGERLPQPNGVYV
jgi:signal transduction histidine kinase